MPSFRALQPSNFRPTPKKAPTGPDASSIHVPVARATVDCGVYSMGSRLPGKYTHGAAVAKVRELRGDAA